MAERLERCATCRFWEQHNPDAKPAGDNPGTCKRFPPTLVPDGDGAVEVDDVLNWFQPTTDGIDWCGEWRAGAE